MSLLEIKNLKKSFDDNVVLKDISLKVERGEVLAIIGPSGSGKSTLLRCITGLEHEDGGEIDFDGTFGLVFQNFNLFPHHSVMKNISNAPIKVQKRDKNEVYKHARELLKKMGLEDKEDAYPCELSGGQQQRVSIARALAMNPDILFFDEPTSALDPVGRKDVLDILSSVKDETSVIFSTHILTDVERICTDIAFLSDGVIKLTGKTDEIRDRYRSEELYIEYDAISDKVKEKLIKKFNDAVSGEDINNNMKFDMSKGEYAELIYFIADNNIKIHKMERIEPSFEDIFLEVTGE